MAQSLPAVAEAYAVAQRAEIAAAVSSVRRLWARMGDDLDGSWRTVGPQLLAVMDAAQERVALGAVEYVPAVLDDTGQRATAPRYELAPDVLVGTAGDGYPTDSLAYHAVVRTKQSIGAGAGVDQALASSSAWLTTAVGTLLSDTARTVERTTAAGRGSTGYVRMLVPPSCGRCVILAGRRYTRSTGFARHPRCDCRTIPASEAVAGDLTTDPHAYLDSLSDADLAHALGSKANALVYREHGADVNQLVNAYRRKGSVRTAQVYGRDVRYTTEGTTRRGRAYRAMRQAGYAQRGSDVKAGRYAAARAPRLMPESILQIAQDPQDVRRLLRLYGWL